MSVPAHLVDAVIWQESRGNPRAVNPRTGASGLMQVMPDTARQPGFGVQPLAWESRFDPSANKRFGTQYLGAMLDRYSGDVDAALAAYNWGPGNADKWVSGGKDMSALPAETRDYITKIKGRLRMADSGQTMTDAAPQFSRDDLLAEAKRRGLIKDEVPQQPQFSRDELLAEAQRRGLIEGAQAEPDAPGFDFTGAARTIVNDMNAGYQGVSPIKTQRETPIGMVRRDMGVVDVDGEQIPIDQFSGENFVTMQGDDGNEWVYARTPEIEDPALASAGRVIGYGIAGGPGVALKQSAGAARAIPEGRTTQAARDALEVGVTPSVGMRGPVAARAAAAGEGFAPTAGRFVDDARRAAGEIGEAATRAARTVGSATDSAADAGAALKAGANLFVDASKSRGSALFKRVGTMIPNKARVAMTQSSDLLSEAVGKFADKPAVAREIGAADSAGLLDDLRAGLSWEQAADLRSELLSATRKQRDAFKSLNDAQKSRLATAITDDMEAAARAAGPEAFAAWKRARDYWRGMRTRVDEALSKIIRADTPEKAFTDVFAMTGDTGRANLKALNGIKKAMPDDAWGEVVSTVITRMGRAKPGAQDAAGEVFSPKTFLTNWNKLTPRAKLLLFEGKGVPRGLRNNLDALARVSERAVDAGAEINKSRSAVTGANMGFALAGAYDPVSTAMLAVGSNVAARLMTNVPMVRALTRFYATGSLDHMKRLARSSAPIAGDAALLLRNMEAQAGSGEPARAR